MNNFLEYENKKVNDNELNYLFLKLQYCEDNCILQIKYLLKLINLLKTKEYDIKKCSIIDYIKINYPKLLKKSNEFKIEDLNDFYLSKIKVKEVKNIHENTNDNIDVNIDNESSLFSDDYFDKRRR